MATTDDGFYFPEANDRILELEKHIERLSESVQAFANGDMGLRCLHPTGLIVPDATSKTVMASGLAKFSGGSEVSLDGVLDWQTWLNYRIVWQFNAIYADTSFGFRVRAGGIDDSDPHYGYTRTRAWNDDYDTHGGNTAVYTTKQDNETVVSPPTGSGYYTTAFGTIDLFKVREDTRLHGTFQSATNYNYQIQQATGAFALDPKVDLFDGFTLFPKTATQFNGNVRVYAYN